MEALKGLVKDLVRIASLRSTIRTVDVVTGRTRSFQLLAGSLLVEQVGHLAHVGVPYRGKGFSIEEGHEALRLPSCRATGHTAYATGFIADGAGCVPILVTTADGSRTFEDNLLLGVDDCD